MAGSSFLEFQSDLDKLWASTKQDISKQLDATAGLPDSKLQLLFDENLRKAYNAFLQCFRNHSLVVEKEVAKIKGELTEDLAVSYGEKLSSLRKQAAEGASLVLKHKDEVLFLNGLVLAQDNLITAAKHKYDLEKTRSLQDEIYDLNKQLAASSEEAKNLSFQLTCSNQLIDQLRCEVDQADDVQKAHQRKMQKEKKDLEHQLTELRSDSKNKDEEFKLQIRELQSMFTSYKKNTEKELEIQTLLNKRRAEAVKALEEERRRHLAAKTKPTPRIGNPEEPPERNFKPYDVLPAPGNAPSRVYRTDAFGQDQSWKEYHGSERRRPGKVTFRTLPVSRQTGPPMTPVMPTVIPTRR